MRHEVEHLDALSAREGFWDDNDAAQKHLATRASLEATIGKFDKLSSDVKELSDLAEMAATAGDAALVTEIGAQLPALRDGVRQLEVARMLADPVDHTNAIVTIHPGAGGVDAQDWAEMLMRMYLRWCERRGFRTEIVDHQPGEEAGIKGASFTVEGAYAYGYLRAEGGVHRLIRISPFDANARRHTAFAAVFVVPDLEEDEGDIEIRPEDLKVDTFRSGGKGGQHVNKTESAIRITHLPSGFIVQCQAERSQHKNRSTAMKMLRGRLFEDRKRKREAEFEETYASDKMEIGFGSQVRTYTLAPYQLVKDERTDQKTANVNAVLDGELDAFIESYLLAAANRANKAGKATN